MSRHTLLAEYRSSMSNCFVVSAVRVHKLTTNNSEGIIGDNSPTNPSTCIGACLCRVQYGCGDAYQSPSGVQQHSPTVAGVDGSLHGKNEAHQGRRT